MNKDQARNNEAREGLDRRGFLKSAAAGAIAGATLPMMAGSRARANAAVSTPLLDTLPTDLPELPKITLGTGADGQPVQITRVICGSNPVEGYSHSTQAMTDHMMEWFTPERRVEYLHAIERCGIDTWQCSAAEDSMESVAEARRQGSNIKWMPLAGPGRGQPSIEEIKSLDPIAIIHHGGRTDAAFRTGRAQEVRDYVKAIKDAGLLAGVSAHNPDVIKQIADEGWENDFFLCCMYNVTNQQRVVDALGTRTVGHPWLVNDPDVMGDVIRQVDKPCMAFKILAAGRLVGRGNQVETAWRESFERIKPTDGIIIGIYKYHTEIPASVRYCDQFGRV